MLLSVSMTRGIVTQNWQRKHHPVHGSKSGDCLLPRPLPTQPWRFCFEGLIKESVQCSAEDCYFIFPSEECDHLVQRVANFFLKDCMDNILVFWGHKVFLAYSQLCHVAQKQPWTMRKECDYLCSGETLLIETGGLTLFFST